MTHPRLVALLSREFGAAVAGAHLADEAPRPTRRHRFWSRLRLCWIGRCGNRNNAPPQRRARSPLVGNLERYVRSTPPGDSIASVARLPHWFQVSVPYLDTAIMALLVATRAWLELSLGKLRLILRAIIYAGLVVGLSGIGLFVFNGSAGTLIPFLNSLAPSLFC